MEQLKHFGTFFAPFGPAEQAGADTAATTVAMLRHVTNGDVLGPFGAMWRP
jgi:hypothetical protein